MASRPAGMSAADHGPTLTAHPGILPQPEPVCAKCPAASWYITDDKPHCFCAAFRALMYGGRHSAVTACDEYETALVERAARLRKASAEG